MTDALEQEDPWFAYAVAAQETMAATAWAPKVRLLIF
jgi:hypothetical protein